MPHHLPEARVALLGDFIRAVSTSRRAASSEVSPTREGPVASITPAGGALKVSLLVTREHLGSLITFSIKVAAAPVAGKRPAMPAAIRDSSTRL